MKQLFVILLLTLSFSSCGQSSVTDSTEQLLATVEQYKQEDPKLISDIAQMLLVGFRP